MRGEKMEKWRQREKEVRVGKMEKWRQREKEVRDKNREREERKIEKERLLTGNIPPVMSVFWVSMKNSIQNEKLVVSGLLVVVSPLFWRLFSLISVISWILPAVDFRYLYTVQ